MRYRDLRDEEKICEGDEVWNPTHRQWLPPVRAFDVYINKRVDETGLQWRRRVTDEPEQPEQPAAPAAVDRGERYRRTIRQSLGDGDEVGREIEIDIADVCHAFELPYMLAQAVKKLCLPGSRGAKDRLKDLREAAWHIQRQIQIEEAQDNEHG